MMDIIIIAISQFAMMMYHAVIGDPVSMRRGRRELQIGCSRNSYDMAFTAPLPTNLRDRYRRSKKGGSFNEVVLITRNDINDDNKATEKQIREAGGRTHTDQPVPGIFELTALLNNQRSTVHPTPEAAAEYDKAYEKNKDKTMRLIREACGDTFFRLRRTLGPGSQFMSSRLNRGDTLVGQMHHPHRAPSAEDFDGKRQLYRAVLFSERSDTCRDHYMQSFPSLCFSAATPMEEVQDSFDWENANSYDETHESLEVWRSTASRFGMDVQR